MYLVTVRSWHDRDHISSSNNFIYWMFKYSFTIYPYFSNCDKRKKFRFLTVFKTKFLVLPTFGALDVLLLRWQLENLLGASSTKRYGFHFVSQKTSKKKSSSIFFRLFFPQNWIQLFFAFYLFFFFLFRLLPYSILGLQSRTHPSLSISLLRQRISFWNAYKSIYMSLFFLTYFLLLSLDSESMPLNSVEWEKAKPR